MFQDEIAGENSFRNFVRADCKTLFIDIPGKHDVTNSYQMKKLFADEIKLSWRMVHEGSVKGMWDQRDWRISKSDAKCIILKEITYQENSKANYIINKNDFFNFLYDEIGKTDDQGTKWTYLEYIQSYGKNPATFALLPEEKNAKDGQLATNTPYLIPGKNYAIAISSGTNKIFNQKEYSTNHVLFGPLDIVKKEGCLESLPDEVN